MRNRSERKSGAFLARAAVPGGIVLFFMGLAVLWVKLNRGPTGWDDSWYLLDSLGLFDALKSHGVSGWLHEFFYVVQLRYKAPLICALPTPVYLIFGRNSHYALYLNILFMPGLLLGVYGIGKHFGGRRVGLLAMFITGSMPEMYGLATWFLVEYGLAVWVVLAIVCLLNSEDLSRPGWVLLLGIICGLGCMQKILFPAYIAPLVIYFLARRVLALRHKQMGVGLMATLAMLVLPVMVIAGPWYAINLKSAVLRAEFSAYSHEEADLHGTGDPFSPVAMFKYVVNIINEGFGAPYFVVAVFVGCALGYLLILRRRSDGPHPGPPPEYRERGKEVETRRGFWGFVLLWTLPFVIFFFGHNKAVRFIAPMLPVFALVLAFGLDRLLEMLKPWGYGLVALLLAYPLFYQVQNSFAVIDGYEAAALPRPEIVRGPRKGIWFVSKNLGAARMIETEAWPLNETLAELDRLALHRGGPVNIMMGWDSKHFNFNNLQTAATQARLPMVMTTTAYYADTPAAAAQLQADIARMNFFLFRENGEQQNRGYNHLLDLALKQVKDPNKFQAIQSPIVFPDGGTLTIYRNLALGAPQPVEAISPTEKDEALACDIRFGDCIALDRILIQRLGQKIRIVYFWKCLKPTDVQYRCFTHARDEAGKTIGWLDHDMLDGTLPTSAWQAGEQVREAVTSVDIPAAKKLYLDMGVYDPDDAKGAQLPARKGDVPMNKAFSMMPGNIGITVDLEALGTGTKPGR